MPKFFCDYCDVYLTHDSMSVRKAHNSGRNHLRNVVDYYQQIGHEKAQAVIDGITSSYAAEGQPMPQAPGMMGFPPNGMPSFPPPMGGAMPPGMPPLPPGFPPMPPGGRGLPPLPPNFQLPPNFAPPGQNGMPPFPPQGAPAQGSPPVGLPFPPPGAGLPNMPPGFQPPGPGQQMSPPPGVRGPPGAPPGVHSDGQ